MREGAFQFTCARWGDDAHGPGWLRRVRRPERQISQNIAILHSGQNWHQSGLLSARRGLHLVGAGPVSGQVGEFFNRRGYLAFGKRPGDEPCLDGVFWHAGISPIFGVLRKNHPSGRMNVGDPLASIRTLADNTTHHGCLPASCASDRIKTSKGRRTDLPL